jgi:uncharacterized protein (TIGR04255 family)
MILEKNDLPKRVTPDFIKEAIVELIFETDLPQEILLGLIFDSLDESYTYVSRPTPTSYLGRGSQEVIVNKRFFYNDYINIQVQHGSFVFSCLDNYLGWDKFFAEIVLSLKQISTIIFPFMWLRIGTRYINHYPNKDLKEIINFNFTFGLPQIHSNSTSFRTEFELNSSKIVLNLKNNIKLPSKIDSATMISTAIVDIDTMSQLPTGTFGNELFKVIDSNHDLGKRLYFSMLTTEFNSSLQKEY